MQFTYLYKQYAIYIKQAVSIQKYKHLNNDKESLQSTTNKNTDKNMESKQKELDKRKIMRKGRSKESKPEN